MNNSKLVNKHCIPCQGGQPPLENAIVREHLEEIGGQWHINDQGHLQNQFKFKDFMGAMDFANRVASLAEKEGHHPNLSISWALCEVEIWTHKINGLTESDFILAAKIEDL